MGVGEGFLCVCVLAVGDKRVGSGKHDSGEDGGACECLEVTPSINVIAWTALPSPTPGFFLFSTLFVCCMEHHEVNNLKYYKYHVKI